MLPDDDAGHRSLDVVRRWEQFAGELRRRLGLGVPLEAHTRARFEGRLGGDLSGAMVHRGPLGGHLARTLGAAALSTGAHVVGSDQALDASTPGGAALLGHELTHVVQRDTDTGGELRAQLVERALAEEGRAEPHQRAHSQVDVDALAERVYSRMVDQLRLELNRWAWTA